MSTIGNGLTLLLEDINQVNCHSNSIVVPGGINQYYGRLELKKIASEPIPAPALAA
jgi:hypothetical protein